MALTDLLSLSTGSTSAITTAFWIFLPLIALSYLVSNRYQKGLNQIPGPWLRSVSTIPRIWSVWQGKSHEDDIAIHRRHGRIVRLAPNLVSISDCAEINQLYGITTKFIKSGFYSLQEVFDENGELMPDTFILNDKAMHSRMKRNAANAYSLNGLVQMEPYVDEVLSTLLSKLDNTEDILDLGAVLQDFSMDAIFNLTFGKNFDLLNRGDWAGLYKPLHTGSTVYMAVLGQIPWTHKFLLKNPRVASWIFGEDKSAVEIVSLAQRETEAGKQRTLDAGPMTFLQRLVMNQKANPKSITDHEILTHTWGNIAAGSDTTATAMRAVFYYLLTYPRVYHKLRDEVRSRLSHPISFADANSVTYLTACVQEAMRLHPSVGMLLGRLVPIGGANICGYDLKAGTEVGINAWVLHRDPNVFPDPDAFYPERWLADVTSEDHLKAMHRSFFAFGHGAHTCSGRHISYLETVKLVPTLLLRYDIELVDGGKGYKFQNLWFTQQEGLRVRISPAHN